MLRQRTASATLIVVGTLAAVVAGGWLFVAAALVTALAALDELMGMLSKAGHHPARLLGHLLVVVFFLVALIGAPGRLLAEALLLAIVGPLLTVMLRRNLTVYGVGGLIAPFIGIKLIDLLISLIPGL